jgi:hypothetical protein
VRSLEPLIGLAVVLGVFLIIREFWTWFWKINDILTALREIQNTLQQTNQLLLNLAALSNDRGKPNMFPVRKYGAGGGEHRAQPALLRGRTPVSRHQ